MIKVGDKLKAKPHFLLRHNIPKEHDIAEVVKYEKYESGQHYAELQFNEERKIVGCFDWFNDFYILENINDEIKKAVDVYEIKEAILKTMDGKTITISL